MDCISEIRYCHFMAGVLARQQHDPLCGKCKALANSVRALREGVTELEQRRVTEISSLPKEQAWLLTLTKQVLAGLNPYPDAVGQKKAGNCRLAEGICFVKSSKAFIKEMEGKESGRTRL
jgi:hypothetical protein